MGHGAGAVAIASQTSLSSIDPKQPANRVAPGSLVATDQGNYYLAIGIGKVSAEGTGYYCISSLAPIARAMLGKSGGDTFVFNGNTVRVLTVY